MRLKLRRFINTSQSLRVNEASGDAILFKLKRARWNSRLSWQGNPKSIDGVPFGLGNSVDIHEGS